MNKQELIDELAKNVKRYENVMDEYSQGRYGAYKVSLKLVKRLNEQNITDEQAWNKVAEAYPESAQSLRNTLDNAVFGKVDEPQKPVVPKFVAEWIEYAKKKGDSLAISFKPWNLYGVEYSKVDRWIEDNQETFARAWLDGYEVEKIQKYIVKIGKLYLKEPLGDTSNSTILTTWNKKCAYPFSSFHMADKHADKFEGAVEEEVER
ncbi:MULTISPECIES: DUF1642 domain-containing protein [Enterococcus]|uniref:DUF1642 domain-containing protein n=1 Tax=Enterococcus TaxID=1350 RepID=UPI0009B55879|nr:DUF1642 domain-containing protein [Enterococcus faecium]AWX47322.1 DUF1642 domain-containing protein [Enterococcus faecium]OZN16815.1 DUF1642 domain-containing protein [Enterococcus faecium]OZN19603.1 DUF1642 domain-containing protein [Enterococcus faecium]